METEETGATPETVETAEATTAEETETVIPQPEESGDQPGEEAKPKKGLEKRFSELTGRAKAAEQYAQRLEEMNRQLLDKIGQPPQKEEAAPQIPPTRPKPTREMVDYDEDRYIEAVADWKAEQREAALIHRYESQRKQEAQRQQQTTLQSSLSDITKKGSEKYEDFAEVAFVPEIIAPLIARADNAEDLAYYLGKNPEARRELIELAQTNPMMVAYRIGQLGVKATVPPKATTKAPAPITPVSGAAPAEKDPEKMSTEEWIKWRNKQVSR